MKLFGLIPVKVLQARRAVMLVLCASFVLSSALFADDKKKSKDAPAPEKVQSVVDKLEISKIVWPTPPAVTRVRYLNYFAGEKLPDFNAQREKKKLTWKDRLAGVSDDPNANTPSLKNHFFLGEPHGIAFDSKGKIYVADAKVGAIFIFDPETKDTEMIKNGQHASFSLIEGLAMDDNDHLFVADSEAHRVLIFNDQHRGEAGITQGLVKPYGLAIDAENRFLYVSDLAQDQVLVYDADKYNLIRRIGVSGKNHTSTEPGEFAKPTGLAVDADGNLYVCDMLNYRIEEFDADGNFIRAFGKHGDGAGYFAQPKGVAVDGDGHVWVSDSLINRVQIYTKEGTLLMVVGNASGILPGMFSGMQNIAFDPRTNRVATSEVFPGRVQLFRYYTQAEARAEYEKKQAAKSADAAKDATVVKTAEAAK